jgi:hypothetical protein
MTDRCLFQILVPEPPPPPAPDFWNIQAGAATYRTELTLGVIADVDAFKSLASGAFVVVPGNPGRYLDFHLLNSKHDYQGNYMNGYPCFIPSWDDQILVTGMGFTSEAAGQLTLKTEPILAGGSRVAESNADRAWIDNQVIDYTDYNNYGARTHQFDGRTLLWSIPRNTGTLLPVLVNSPNGGQTLIPKDFTVGSTDYHKKDIKGCCINPDGSAYLANALLSVRTSTQYYGVNINDEFDALLKGTVPSSVRPQSFNYMKALDGIVGVMQWSTSSDWFWYWTVGDGTVGFNTNPKKSGPTLSDATYSKPVPIIDADGECFMCVGKTDRTGAKFYHLTSGSYVDLGFTPAFDGGSRANLTGYDPILMEDGNFLYIARGGYGDRKGIMYGHPLTGWTVEYSSDINDPPFAGIFNPGASVNNYFQRCRVFEI